MREPIIAGNWKMHMTRQQAATLAAEVAQKTAAHADAVQVVVAPTMLSVGAVVEAVAGSHVQVALQTMHWAEQGAYTGEVSAEMAQDAGCQVVILGHSERRQHFGETDEGVNRKARAALDAGLTPIVCFGESLEERKGGQTESKVRFQVSAALIGISAEDAPKLVLAYEPIWAIGTGQTASPQQAQDVHAGIRALLTELYGGEVASQVRVQYGGSVKPDNIAELIAQPDIDGALVGGASLKADSFAALVASARAGARRDRRVCL